MKRAEINLAAPLTASLQNEPLVFRRSATATEHIARFVFLLLAKITSNAAHYDAIQSALDETGIQPCPSRSCRHVHFETQLERVNRLADVLLARIMEDKTIHASICAVTLSVLNELTTPAPADHLTDAELQTYAVCCSGFPNVPHLADYDVYAAHHAHIGSCSGCEKRLTKLASEPPT
jgi:hypothetical protein